MTSARAAQAPAAVPRWTEPTASTAAAEASRRLAPPQPPVCPTTPASSRREAPSRAFPTRLAPTVAVTDMARPHGDGTNKSEPV